MNSRVRWVSVAVVAMLTVAAMCLADEPNYRPGRGGIGGQFGFSSFRLDRWLGKSWFGDYSEGSKNRFAFAASFRYIVNPHLRLQLSPGFAWAGYHAEVPAPFDDVRFPNDDDKGDMLTRIVPVSLQGQAVMRRGRWLYHAGAGPSVVRVWVTNHKEILKDPLTLDLHRGMYFGASGEIGAERFFSELNSSSVEMVLGGDLALTQRDDQFVSGFNSNLGAVELRIGLNYYFDTGIGKKKEPPAASPKP